MIGVVAQSNEHEVVDEFFQLFKTPWEFFRQGRSYDVIVATTDEIPEVDAKLVLIYRAELRGGDAALKAAARPSGNVNIYYQGRHLPLYGPSLMFEEPEGGTPFLTADAGVAGVTIHSTDRTILRLGYDLFREVQFLLSIGQPSQNAHVPALEMHIGMMRDWILDAGIALLEIPPSPGGHKFVVCLTHDIDFMRIRDHKFDHTMWGFLYRSTVDAVRNFARRRISLSRLLRCWRAAASLPFVYLGWAKDFWLPFDWYLEIEKSLPSTYFLIPFKRRLGDRVTGQRAKWRATTYDIMDIPEWTSTLLKNGREVGVHGLDAWHSVDEGRTELKRIAAVTGELEVGVRMHWLLRDDNTFRVLDEAGYAYDSTAGYNETIGYQSGTTQVYRPFGSLRLLELPLHIQDGAMFYRKRLDLSEPEAWRRCETLITNAREFGGVLTILWHDRSHGPERFWGEFYARLLKELKSHDPWFGTAAQVTRWFRQRRDVAFERVPSAHGPDHVRIRSSGSGFDLPFTLRVHYSDGGVKDGNRVCSRVRRTVDFPWTGQSEAEIGQLLRAAINPPAHSRLPIPSRS